MGLDLYVGTLSRYYTGKWETIVQRVGREEGLDVVIEYAGGAPRRLPGVVAPFLVSLWRKRLQRKFGHLLKNNLDWQEDGAKPYFTDKPDTDGKTALVLAMAHAEYPNFGLPIAMPDSFEDDPAY